jgi:hypothetical protein
LPALLFLLLLLLLLLNAAPAGAGVGLPEVGSLQIGPYRARLLNDSAGLRTGRNTLTVHIADLPADHRATLRLHGPRGEVIDVPLRPLRVLPGPAGGHAAGAATTPEAGHDDPTSRHDQEAHAGAAAGAHAPDAHTPGRKDQRADLHDEEADGGHAPVDPAHAGHAPVDPAHAGDSHGAAPDGHDAAVPDGHEAGAHGGETFMGYAVRGTAGLPAPGAWRAVLTVGNGHGEPLRGELPLDVTTDGPNPLYLGALGVLAGGSVLYGWIGRRRAGRRR